MDKVLITWNVDNKHLIARATQSMNMAAGRSRNGWRSISFGQAWG